MCSHTLTWLSNEFNFENVVTVNLCHNYYYLFIYEVSVYHLMVWRPYTDSNNRCVSRAQRDQATTKEQLD